LNLLHGFMITIQVSGFAHFRRIFYLPKNEESRGKGLKISFFAW